MLKVPSFVGVVGGAMVFGKFLVPGVQLILTVVGQEPTVFAIGAGGSCLDTFFSPLTFLFFLSFSLSLGDSPIQTEVLTQRAVKRKTTNRPTVFGRSNVFIHV